MSGRGYSTAWPAAVSYTHLDVYKRQDRERIRREEGRTIGAVHEVEDWLGLKGLNRMEAFDISNISGFESVGSMVVYEKGKPKRSDYRKFRIKSVQGPNDYASMEEMCIRDSLVIGTFRETVERTVHACIIT